MITSQGYLAFRLAALNGHLSILQYLTEKAPEHQQNMIEYSYYEKSPEKLQELEIKLKAVAIIISLN